MKIKLAFVTLLVVIFSLIGYSNTQNQIKQSQALAEKKQLEQSKTGAKESTASTVTGLDLGAITKSIMTGEAEGADVNNTVAQILENLDSDKLMENQDIISNFCPNYKSQNISSFIKTKEDLEPQFGDKAGAYFDLITHLNKTCEDDKVSVDESLYILTKAKDLDIDLSQFGF